MSLERTFGIIKPDAVANGHTGAILSFDSRSRLQGGWVEAAAQLRRREAEAFYAVHKARPFFGGLVTFMTERPGGDTGVGTGRRHCQMARIDGGPQIRPMPRKALSGSGLPRISNEIPCTARTRRKPQRRKFPFSLAAPSCYS